MHPDENYSRWIRAEDGRETKRYTAIDPAEVSIVCTCRRAECHRARLLPFREHIAELYRVILKLHEEDVGWASPSTWDTCFDALACINALEARLCGAIDRAEVRLLRVPPHVFAANDD